MPLALFGKFERFHKFNQWIAWNLFLAFIPLAISFYLFRRSSTERSKLWWVAFVVYMAFLPNAPYVLTDIIHLVSATRNISSMVIVTFFYIPLHLGAILLGFEAYVISLINQSFYLRRIGLKKYIIWTEILTHIVCAIGVYLGRFLRFNSWDLVTSPKDVVLATLNELTGKGPLAVIVITVLILTLLYWVMKQVTIGVLLRMKEVRSGQHSFD